MKAAPVVTGGWRLPILARRELAALVADADRGAWLIGWAEYLLADLRTDDGLPAIRAKDRKRSVQRLDAACGDLVDVLRSFVHSADGDSQLQYLIEHAAEAEPLAPGWHEPLSVACVMVDLLRLQTAARRLGALPVPPGRQLDDRTAIACDVFRLALIACGIRDARSADTKMGEAFAVFLQAGGLARSDVRSLLQALANWRQSHPADTGLYLGSLG